MTDQIVENDHEFYGYRMIQNQSNERFALYVGAANASILRDIVSTDNAVVWDRASGNWCDNWSVFCYYRRYHYRNDSRICSGFYLFLFNKNC